jgi:UDP:flavonoid glycosyltransferase YjiC (YdhE family)
VRITILTVGTRGDVQPYIALGIGLRAVGHDVTLATHCLWAERITTAGLRFAQVEGSPGNFMYTETGLAWMEHGARPLPFLRTVLPEMLRLLRIQLDDALNACRDAEGLVFTHLAVAGYHIAERFGLPCCAASLQPVSPTRCFPSPVLPPGFALGLFNKTSHVMVERGYAELWRGEINRWRREKLGLAPLPPGSSYFRLRGKELPLLYAFSESVIPRPPDWSINLHVTGYLFLKSSAEWDAPEPLGSFLSAGKAPLYVGFGSMVVRDPGALAGLVQEACRRAGQRAIISIAGFCPRDAADPSSFRFVDDVPHDCLFPRTAAVVHHGGAGTTAAGLRAGVPTVVVPIVSDQFFWGERVHALGAGPRPVPFTSLTAAKLASAISRTVSSAPIRARAAELGIRIRGEDGVARGVAALEEVLGAPPPARPRKGKPGSRGGGRSRVSLAHPSGVQ